MILERRHFDIADKAVFERLKLGHPLRKDAVFEDTACFLYSKQGHSSLVSANETIHMGAEESVLLSCGSYFNEYLKKDDDKPSDVYAVHLHKEVLQEIYKNDFPELLLATDKAEYAVKFEGSSLIEHFISSLDFYFDNPQLVSQDLLKLKIKELILLLLQSKNAQSVSELMRTLFSPRETDLKRLVEQHLYSKLSVQEFAHLANLSLSSFKREFKEAFRDSPKRYLTSKKLTRAEELLTLTDKSVGEIALEVGFEYSSNFAKAFKKKNGCTALQFRAEHELAKHSGPKA